MILLTDRDVSRMHSIAHECTRDEFVSGFTSFDNKIVIFKRDTVGGRPIIDNDIFYHFFLIDWPALKIRREDYTIYPDLFNNSRDVVHYRFHQMYTNTEPEIFKFNWNEMHLKLTEFVKFYPNDAPYYEEPLIQNMIVETMGIPSRLLRVID